MEANKIGSIQSNIGRFARISVRGGGFRPPQAPNRRDFAIFTADTEPQSHEKIPDHRAGRRPRRPRAVHLLPLLLRLRRGREERRTELCRLQRRDFQNLRRQAHPVGHPLEDGRDDPVLRIRIFGARPGAGPAADAGGRPLGRTALQGVFRRPALARLHEIRRGQRRLLLSGAFPAGGRSGARGRTVGTLTGTTAFYYRKTINIF